ncbi:hypothetical protein EYF80_008671 [Liparis tanakae]|uniref:Uncharacterized protein n=1 Tax=Liparis tanakae TaxID=230148 RepID=A0A4Z2ISY4_9TELE|nr:hypothetical protein EYF80_008671 [Liparis tanakae]
MDSRGVNKMEVYYLSVGVVLLHPGEIVLGLLELALSNLDLLVLAGHLQQGLHLMSQDSGSEEDFTLTHPEQVVIQLQSSDLTQEKRRKLGLVFLSVAISFVSDSLYS